MYFIYISVRFQISYMYVNLSLNVCVPIVEILLMLKQIVSLFGNTLHKYRDIKYATNTLNYIWNDPKMLFLETILKMTVIMNKWLSHNLDQDFDYSLSTSGMCFLQNITIL